MAVRPQAGKSKTGVLAKYSCKNTRFTGGDDFPKPQTGAAAILEVYYLCVYRSTRALGIGDGVSDGSAKLKRKEGCRPRYFEPMTLWSHRLSKSPRRLSWVLAGGIPTALDGTKFEVYGNSNFLPYRSPLFFARTL